MYLTDCIGDGNRNVIKWSVFSTNAHMHMQMHIHMHTHTHTHTHTKLTLTREHIVYVTQKHRTDICLVIKELNSGETVHKITHINVKTVTINEIMIKIVYSICHAGLVSQSQ